MKTAFLTLALLTIGGAAFADDYTKCNKIDKGGYFNYGPVGCDVLVKTGDHPAPKMPDPCDHRSSNHTASW